MVILKYRDFRSDIEVRFFPVVAVLLLLIIPAFFLPGAFSEDILSSPVKHLESYNFSKELPLIERVGKVPDFVLKAWMEWDGRSNYSPYTVTADEREIIREYLSLVPPLTHDVMKERMIGIYFIENFLGSGLTDWVVDSDNNIHTYMIFNKKTLKMNLSELITWKEKTCFKNDDPSMSVDVDINSPMNGFLYILLHESTHIVDYVENITPYTEPDMKRFMKKVPDSTLFTDGIWSGYSETVTPCPFRGKVTFYGMKKGPRAGITEAAGMYDSMFRSPFISLYGTLNWAEDLAEYLAFYHLTEKMGFSYRIRVSRGNRVIHLSEPAQNELVRKRFSTLDVFYHPRSFSKKK